MKGKGHKIVLWGSGSKAVAFLTALELPNAIEFVVDINPHRQGNFVPGTGQQIVSAEFLTAYKPDTVIAMNSIYRPEIQEDLNGMHVSATLLGL